MSCVELLSPTEATPDNLHWHKLRREGISASEIAAVLGISPWDSPFSLYWQKVNGWDTEDNEEMATGRRVEPVVASWWAETIGVGLEAYVRPAGLYASEVRKWQLATPDRLVRRFTRPGVGQLVSVLECKWTGSWDGWGEPGTDDIPVYYRAQVLWQCDVLGVDEWHLAMLGPGGFRAYTGRRDETDLTVVREAGRRFVDRLAAGDAPDVDGHSATLSAVKRLHPDIEDRDEQISPAVADGYRRARALKARVTAAADRWEARLRAEMAAARRAVDADGRLVASRSIYDRAGYEVGPARIDRLNPGRSKK